MTSSVQRLSRASSPSLDAILGESFPVLDHGFIRVIDYMGNDAAIVQGARVSYGEGTKSVSEDAGLINYLMMNEHTSPFEMCELKIHVKMPIFVARQWVRHRTASLNEVSGRYSVLPQEFYLPEATQLRYQSTANKQGREENIPESLSREILQRLRADAEQIFAHYKKFLDLSNTERTEEGGLARELARINLPLSTYTELYWKIDLHNLLHFLALRASPHAQYEIRAYAEVLLSIVKRWVPLTHAAFVKHRLEGARLSRESLLVMRRMLAGERLTQETSGLSAREWNALCLALQL